MCYDYKYFGMVETLYPYQYIPRAAVMTGENVMGKGSKYPFTLKVTGQVCENQKKYKHHYQS